MNQRIVLDVVPGHEFDLAVGQTHHVAVFAKIVAVTSAVNGGDLPAEPSGDNGAVPNIDLNAIEGRWQRALAAKPSKGAIRDYNAIIDAACDVPTLLTELRRRRGSDSGSSGALVPADAEATTEYGVCYRNGRVEVYGDQEWVRTGQALEDEPDAVSIVERIVTTFASEWAETSGAPRGSDAG